MGTVMIALHASSFETSIYAYSLWQVRTSEQYIIIMLADLYLEWLFNSEDQICWAQNLLLNLKFSKEANRTIIIDWFGKDILDEKLSTKMSRKTEKQNVFHLGGITVSTFITAFSII